MSQRLGLYASAPHRSVPTQVWRRIGSEAIVFVYGSLDLTPLELQLGGMLRKNIRLQSRPFFRAADARHPRFPFGDTHCSSACTQVRERTCRYPSQLHESLQKIAMCASRVVRNIAGAGCALLWVSSFALAADPPSALDVLACRFVS